MRVFVVGLFCFVLGIYAQNNDYDLGIKLYKVRNYAQAQKIFENLLAQNENNAELWYLFGLCQRAQNQFTLAKQSQKKAIILDPNNIDIHLELVRLNLRLDSQEDASYHVQKALDIDPDNELALALEKKIKQAKKSTSGSVEKKKPLSYVGLGYEYSIISRANQPDWKKQELFAGTWLADNINLHGHVQNYTRFNNDQQHYGLGLLYISPQDHAFDVTLSKGFSTAFLPKTRLRTDLDFKIFHTKEKTISGLRFTFNGQYDQYDALKIGVIKPGTKILFKHGFDLHLQSILIIDENRDDVLYGVTSRVDWFSPNNIWHLFTGVSFAPETDNAIVIDTSAFYLGGRYKLKSNLDLIVSYSHENRKQSFLRDIISFYLRKHF